MNKNKINVVFLSLLMLITTAGCSSTSSSMKMNSYVTADVEVKNNAEYIAIPQYTSIDDFNIEDYLDIAISDGSDYEVKWLGESLSDLEGDTYDEAVSHEVTYEVFNGWGCSDGDYAVARDLVSSSQEDTLNNEGFRQIAVYVKYTDSNGEEKTIIVRPILLIVPDDLASTINSVTTGRIEDVYTALYSSYYGSPTSTSEIASYLSGIRAHDAKIKTLSNIR